MTPSTPGISSDTAPTISSPSIRRLRRRGAVVALTLALAAVGSACGATDVVGNVQQCADVGAAVARVSVVAAGSQASGQDLTAASEALAGVGDVPSDLRGPFDALEQAFGEGKGFDDPAVQSAYDEIRSWVETESVPGSLGDLLGGN